MKISRRKLNTLIENFLKESDDSSLMLKKIIKNKEMIQDVSEIARMFMAAKNEAGLGGADKYFHFLCFHAIGTYIRENASDFIDDFTFNFTVITAGLAKEIIYDGLFHLITKGSPEIEDMEVNILGLQQGISGKPPEETAKKLAPRYTEKAKQLIKNAYYYAIDMRPDIYDVGVSESEPFMLPRYCVWLADDERQYSAAKDGKNTFMTNSSYINDIIIKYIGYNSESPGRQPQNTGKYPPKKERPISK